MRNALPNIALGRRIIPELFEPTVKSIMAELRPLLADHVRRDRVLEDYGEMRRLLGPAGAMRRIADCVIAAARVARQAAA